MTDFDFEIPSSTKINREFSELDKEIIANYAKKLNDIISELSKKLTEEKVNSDDYFNILMNTLAINYTSSLGQILVISIDFNSMVQVNAVIDELISTLKRNLMLSVEYYMNKHRVNLKDKSTEQK